jgi:pyridoxal 5'-phosphate synthase glutaminase subunit Pdx2
MPVDQVTTIVASVASALDSIHSNGMLHRDVKPANILCAEPAKRVRRIALADFGIARQINDSSGITATNMTIGTVSYAAPEQLMGKTLDGRSDQRSFGAIDISVRRNAFGRQIDSFESDIPFSDGSSDLIRAVFIRAPWVEDLGSEVEVISSVKTPAGEMHPVAVRQKHLMATSFHPELTHDLAVHRYFFDEVCK